jgi:glycosyltransferase involved in cell wall biosynthesis
MNILTLLNVSNISNLEADSGYVFQKLLMEEILSQRPDWNFFFISPKGTETIDDRIKFIEIDYGHNKFEARFNFPWKELKEKVEKIIHEIDLIYVNQSELATNFKALATTICSERKIPLVSYYHYLPLEPSHVHFGQEGKTLDYDMIVDLKEKRFPSSIRFDHTLNNHDLALPIFLREIEATYSSDYNVTCSNFGIDLFLSNAQKIVPSISGNFTAIPPPVSFKEIENALKDFKKPSLQKKVILFNHRLYSHYGPKEFFEVMNGIYNTIRQDFEVIVTHPTHGRSIERSKLDSSIQRTEEAATSLPFVKIRHSKTREEYYRTVASSYVAIGPMKPSALWSMSTVDALACGVPTLCPAYACFPELLGNNSGLLFSSSGELIEKISLLMDNPSVYQEKSAYCKERAGLFEVKNTAKKFIELFEKVRGR